MKEKDPKEKPKRGLPTVKVKPSKHHPTKSELEKDLSIPDATPEKLARAVSNYKLNKRG